jgi:ligand-binding sensor domain-containing protein
MWFATGEGLARFDGYEFINYGLNEGLPSASVGSLLVTRNGGLWVGTLHGLCRFHPKSLSASARRFAVYLPSASRDTHIIYALAEEIDGSILCGTAAGLFRLRKISASSPHFEPIDLGDPSVGMVRAWIEAYDSTWTNLDFVWSLIITMVGVVASSLLPHPTARRCLR